jgi:tRNA A37 methylthiotransferase MiaB
MNKTREINNLSREIDTILETINIYNEKIDELTKQIQIHSELENNEDYLRITTKKKDLELKIEQLKLNKQKLGAWCFPIQSGSDAVLKRMRRPYRISDVLSVLKRLKTEVPEMQIGTHFIIGFPGETEEDFQKTLDFFNKAPLDFLNVFRYTDHIRAESHGFSDKISESIIIERENRFEIKFYQKYHITLTNE